MAIAVQELLIQAIASFLIRQALYSSRYAKTFLLDVTKHSRESATPIMTIHVAKALMTQDAVVGILELACVQVDAALHRGLGA